MINQQLLTHLHFLKKFLLSVCCLIGGNTTYAQVHVRFALKERTVIHHDSIFVSGSFSNWDSTSNRDFLLQPTGSNEKFIVLTLKPGIIKYKFHRGNWITVEKQFDGDEVPDRVVNIRKDTALTDSVFGWRDQIVTDKKLQLQSEKTDSDRIKLLAAIAGVYAFHPEFYNADSALFYAQNAQQLHQKLLSTAETNIMQQAGYVTQILKLQEVLASLFHSLGNYPKSLELRFDNLKLAENINNKYVIIEAINNIIHDYEAMKDFQNMLKYGKLMDSITNTLPRSDPSFISESWFANEIISTAFYNLNQLDAALQYANKMRAEVPTNEIGYIAFGDKLYGDIYTAKNQNDSAILYYRGGIYFGHSIGASQLVGASYAGLAKIFQKEGKLDSALAFARKALNAFQTNKINIRSWGENSDSYIAEFSPLLAELYKSNNQLDSAYKYLLLSVTLKDSLYNTNKIRQFQTLSFEESSRRSQVEQQVREAKDQYQTKVKIYGLTTGMLGLLILAFVFYRNTKNKQKANVLLQAQKQEIENTLSELKHTQRQLIQSEKMASLGELTAGIAHEIQNPLNFVNNFSEINTELIGELREEESKPLAQRDENLEKELLNNISQNLEKIAHHGKRADAIVKGMLQHSRSSNGQKEPVLINALCDEYLRLSYHGLRAKDKSFNATMKTDFDENLQLIHIIPQDMGRVLLNLINNAFYAVDEKKKQYPSGYEPTVSLSTRKVGGQAQIRVSDNGNGIPQRVLDKIFQPFFTTKPTGIGTGLGLSLSYDIVKAHGGEIKVDTKENMGTSFTILLPV